MSKTQGPNGQQNQSDNDETLELPEKKIKLFFYAQERKEGCSNNKIPQRSQAGSQKNGCEEESVSE